MSMQTDGKYLPPVGNHVRQQSSAALHMTTQEDSSSLCPLPPSLCVCVWQSVNVGERALLSEHCTAESNKDKQ